MLKMLSSVSKMKLYLASFVLHILSQLTYNFVIYYIFDDFIQTEFIFLQKAISTSMTLLRGRQLTKNIHYKKNYNKINTISHVIIV